MNRLVEVVQDIGIDINSIDNIGESIQYLAQLEAIHTMFNTHGECIKGLESEFNWNEGALRLIEGACAVMVSFQGYRMMWHQQTNYIDQAPESLKDNVRFSPEAAYDMAMLLLGQIQEIEDFINSDKVDEKYKEGFFGAIIDFYENAIMSVTEAVLTNTVEWTGWGEEGVERDNVN